MALSKETVLQIIACHAKGMTVREIAKKAGLEAAQVEVCLQDHGKKPIYNKAKQDEAGKRKKALITDEQKEEVHRLAEEGRTQYYIAKKVGIAPASVSRILNANKEKEPATAATVTDSEVKDEKENVSANSFSNNNTDTAKSQVLLKYIKCDLYGIYEKLSQAERNAWDLGEMYARVTDHLKEVVGE
jgi:predicted transcriptional regulator